MKKRTALIGAILSLIPLGQPLIIKTGAVLSTTGFLLSVSEKVNAETSDFYFQLKIFLLNGYACTQLIRK